MDMKGLQLSEQRFSSPSPGRARFVDGFGCQIVLRYGWCQRKKEKLREICKNFKTSRRSKKKMLEAEERRREIPKKPRKYQICMKTNKGKIVNTCVTKRPKYSLKNAALYKLKWQIGNFK
jgi:hypothetical protein